MAELPLPDPQALFKHLSGFQKYIDIEPQFVVKGRLNRMVGLMLEAEGCQLPVGGRCLIEIGGHHKAEAEVVGFDGNKIYLMPVSRVEGLRPGAEVIPLKGAAKLPTGDSLLGRVVNGQGVPLDNLGLLVADQYTPLLGATINPLERTPIEEPLDVGVRSINSLMTVGKGQRMGLFAGSGVGKSVLMGMMTKFTEADISIVGLIGERGREVKEFIEQILGEAGLKRSIVVAAPADDPPLMRIYGAYYATALAEYYRDKGKNVLLLMDSLTRFAQAQREIALAVGEPPATKGYPPSVFAKIPQLVERAGNGNRGSGSITAFYTVLTEGDDVQDPVADSARAILDGHIVLSRRIAEEGIYPAIDVEASISRAMPQIVPPEQLELAYRFKQIHSSYSQNRDLITVGAYKQGSDPSLDLAIERHRPFQQFLQQKMDESVNYAESVEQLIRVLQPKNELSVNSSTG